MPPRLTSSFNVEGKPISNGTKSCKEGISSIPNLDVGCYSTDVWGRFEKSVHFVEGVVFDQGVGIGCEDGVLGLDGIETHAEGCEHCCSFVAAERRRARGDCQYGRPQLNRVLLCHLLRLREADCFIARDVELLFPFRHLLQDYIQSSLHSNFLIFGIMTPESIIPSSIFSSRIF